MLPNLYVFFAVVGLIFGSFFNVIIFRVPRILENNLNNKTPKQSILKNISYPQSHCLSCKKTIRWFNNIPLLSWLYLRGKCKSCGVFISPIYIIVEFITMLCFVFIYAHYGLHIEALGWLLFFSLLIILFFTDLTSFYLPNIFTYPLIGIGILFSLFGWTSIDIQSSLIGGVLGFLLFFIINFCYKAWRGINGFGDADKILLAGLGVWLGYKSLYPIIMFSSFVGLGFMLIMFSLGKRYQMETRLPFGPFLISSGLLVYIHLHVYPITFMRFFYEL